MEIERDALYELDIHSCEPLRVTELWTMYEVTASSNGMPIEVRMRSFHDLPLGVGAYRLEWYVPRWGTDSLTLRPPLHSQLVALDLNRLAGPADVFVGDVVGENPPAIGPSSQPTPSPDATTTAPRRGCSHAR